MGYNQTKTEHLVSEMFGFCLCESRCIHLVSGVSYLIGLIDIDLIDKVWH